VVSEYNNQSTHGECTVFLVSVCWLSDCFWPIYRHCFNIWSYAALSDMVSPKMDCTMNRSGFRRGKWCSMSGFYSHIFLNLFNNNVSTACVWSNVCRIVNNEEGGWYWWLSVWWSAAARLLVSQFRAPWGHGFSFLVFVVRCVGSGLRDEPISRSEETYRVCVCVSNYVWSRNLNN
jgi:hypothetical protein